MRVCLAALLAALLLSSVAGADSWTSPTPMDAVSRNGQWKILVSPGARWSQSKFELARLVTKDGERDWETVAKGTCHHPCEVRCMNDGSFLLFDRWGMMGTSIKPGVSVHARDGSVRWAKHAQAWFTDEAWLAQTHTTSSVWWYEGLWIAEEAGVIVVISWDVDGDRAVVPIRLSDGRRVDVDNTIVLNGMRTGTDKERVLATETARMLKTPGAVTAARALYDRTDLSPLFRLHLALVIASEHDPAAQTISTAARGAKDLELRKLAILHLREAEGDGATPYLLEVLRQGDEDTWWEAVLALAGQGLSVIPRVSQVLLDEKLPPIARDGAAHVFGQLGKQGRLALPALLAAAIHARDGTSNGAINVLREIVSPTEVAALYAGLTREKTGDDDLVALLLQNAPSRDAVWGLERKLERMSKDHSQRDWYEEALAACRKAAPLKPKVREWAGALIREGREHKAHRPPR